MNEVFTLEVRHPDGHLMHQLDYVRHAQSGQITKMDDSFIKETSTFLERNEYGG